MSTEKKSSGILVKILKWFGIFLLVIIIALAVLPFVFKGKLVALVKEEANKQLNAKVDFGEFDLTIFRSFPDLRFNISDVNIVGTDDFEGDTLLALKKLSIDLNLKSVIQGKNYEIHSLSLDNPRVWVQVLKNGKASYDIAKTDSSAAPEDTGKAAPFQLKLSSLKITDAYIIYDDQKGGMYANIQDLDYELKGDFSDDFISTKNKLEISKTTIKNAGITYLNEAKISANADVDADIKNKKYTFKENEFNINELGIFLDGSLGMPKDAIDLNLKLNAKKTEFKTILSLIPAVYKKDFETVQTKGSFSLSAYANGLYSEKTYPAFGLDLKVDNAYFKYPSLPQAVDNIFIDLKIKNPNGNLNATTIALNKFNFTAAGNPLSVVAHVKTPISDPDFDFSANGKINLSSVNQFIPMEKDEELNGMLTANLKVAGRLSYVNAKQYDKFISSGTLDISGMKIKNKDFAQDIYLNIFNLKFSNAFVELLAMDAKIGNTDMKATGRIDNFINYIFKEDLIKGTFNFNSNLVDINQLTGSIPQSSGGNQQSAPKSTTESKVVEIPGNIDFELNTNVKKVLYDNMTFENLNGKVVIRDNRFSMNGLKLNTLGGEIRMNGYYDTKNQKNPEINLNFMLDNFDIASTYKTFNSMPKLAPIAQYASGNFSAGFDNLTGKLNSKMEPELESVNAKGIFKTKSVTVGGFEPFSKLSDALKIKELRSLTFQNVNFQFEIKSGRIFIKPFDVNIDKIKATISGSSGLDQSIDYTWNMKIPRSLFGASANSTINGLISQANSKVGTNFTPGETIFIDVIFGGTMSKPTVKTSIKEGLKDIVNDVKEQVIEVVKEKASEQADKILADARRESERIRAEARATADKLKAEGYAAADKLVNEAKNPIARMAAQESAKVAKRETDKKVQKILDDADAKANKVLQEAQAKSDATLKK
jgi:vacuolar-type H+-ATPase subunit H